MKQVRPNGVMEDSPLPSPVTSPNCITEEVGVSVGGEGEEPKHRKGVKRSLEDVEGERERREGERGRERDMEEKREVWGERGKKGVRKRSQSLCKKSQIPERGIERKMTASYITLGYNYPVCM